MSQSQFFSVNEMHVYLKLTRPKQHLEHRQKQVFIQVIKNMHFCGLTLSVGTFDDIFLISNQ